MLTIVALSLQAGPALAATPRASSEKRDDDGTRHRASLAFDGLLSTGWAEGEEASGEGAWLELKLDRVTQIDAISIWPGNLAKGTRTIREFDRPRTLELTLTGKGDPVTKTVHLPDPSSEGPLRVDVDVGAQAHSVRLTIKDTYGAGIHSDTYIAEVAVNFTRGEVPKSVERVKTWLDADASKSTREKSDKEVIALFDQINAAEFGDRDAMGKLIERAGDGAPWLRRKVAREVGAGYRVHALPPDPTAIEALLKLKDANAIPAIERAALRTTGKSQKDLGQKVEMFYAHQELVGKRFNVPAWGGPGFEPGALRGFGEPLPLEIDSQGRILVADVANHRVQVFNSNGVAESAYGVGDPIITNVWLYGGRPWYAAGMTPSDKPGGFYLPLDLALIPGKLGDSIAVLDYKGRVQVIAPDGAVTELFKVSDDEPLSPGVGGEGYLEYAKGKLAAVWGNQVFVHDLEGNEVAIFKLDRVPSGATSLKDGKLAVIFGKELVKYSLDGFRHGDIIEGSHGKGFEAWDVAVDEKGKLWVATDTGWLIKYKKPGKVDFQVRFSDAAEVPWPRIAVRDNVVYLTSKDTLDRFDALEMKARADLDEADADSVEELPEAP